jgi:hypothetical protein
MARFRIRAFMFGQRAKTAGLATAIALTVAMPAWARSHVLGFVSARSSNDNLNTAERYVWDQAKQGLPANFNKKCEDWLDPKQGDDPGWQDKNKCRTLRATFVAWPAAGFVDGPLS